MKPTLTEVQKDGLTEVINIGVGRAAGYLNEMVGSKVDLKIPEIRILPPTDIGTETRFGESEEISCVYLDFFGGLIGKGVFALPTEDAVKLSAALTGEAIDSPELLSSLSDTLTETGNILVNGVMGSIVDLLEMRAEFAVPGFIKGRVVDVMKVFKVDAVDVVVFIKAEFNIRDHDIGGNILLLFQMQSFETLISEINRLYLEG